MTFERLRFDSLDSTNEEAKRRLAEGSLVKKSIICALEQTAGKGTQGRQWISPRGAGLYFSIVHPGENEVLPVTPILTLAAGVACARAIADLTGLTIQLKPINDLYLDGRKLGGILVESLVCNNRCRGLVTGIGMNILMNEETVAACKHEARGNHPISLQEGLMPLYFSRVNPEQVADELMNAIAEQVETAYQQIFAGKTHSLLTEYLRYKIPEMPLPPELLSIFQHV